MTGVCVGDVGVTEGGEEDGGVDGSGCWDGGIDGSGWDGGTDGSGWDGGAEGSGGSDGGGVISCVFVGCAGLWVGIATS